MRLLGEQMWARALGVRASESARQGEELFQSLLALSFGEGLSEAFDE